MERSDAGLYWCQVKDGGETKTSQSVWLTVEGEELCGPFGLELRAIPLQKRTQSKLGCPTVSCGLGSRPVVLTLPNASFHPLIEFPMLW